MLLGYVSFERNVCVGVMHRWCGEKLSLPLHLFPCCNVDFEHFARIRAGVYYEE